MKIEFDKFYSIGEVALILGVSENTIRRRITDKKITYIKDGSYRIPGSAISEYIEKTIQRAENKACDWILVRGSDIYYVTACGDRSPGIDPKFCDYMFCHNCGRKIVFHDPDG